MLKVTELGFKEVYLIVPNYFSDSRGYSYEPYVKKELEQNNIKNDFIQEYHSYSAKKGTLRGIHFQVAPFSQAKIVRCIYGHIFDVVVDLRKNSSTYKKWCAIELSAENRKQIYIPHGFGHAFLTLSDNCEVLYKMDQYYNADASRNIRWNDPDINIVWPIENPILSIADAHAPYINDSDVNF